MDGAIARSSRGEERAGRVRTRVTISAGRSAYDPAIEPRLPLLHGRKKKESCSEPHNQADGHSQYHPKLRGRQKVDTPKNDSCDNPNESPSSELRWFNLNIQGSRLRCRNMNVKWNGRALVNPNLDLRGRNRDIYGSRGSLHRSGHVWGGSHHTGSRRGSNRSGPWSSFPDTSRWRLGTRSAFTPRRAFLDYGCDNPVDKVIAVGARWNAVFLAKRAQLPDTHECHGLYRLQVFKGQ
jgi:hypothetical protein